MEFTIVGKQGETVEYCSEDKVNTFYLKYNVAIPLDDRTLQLKIDYDNDGNEYFAHRLKPSCVVCNKIDRTGGHTSNKVVRIIPTVYVKLLPIPYSEHNNMNIVRVCSAHHQQWTNYSDRYAAHWTESLLGTEYIELKECAKVNDKFNSIIRLLQNRERIELIPMEKVESLLREVKELSGNNITLDNVHSIEQRDRSAYNTVQHERGYEMAFERYLQAHSLDQFILMWRELFIEHMKPSFMDPVWLANYKTKFKGIHFKGV